MQVSTVTLAVAAGMYEYHTSGEVVDEAHVAVPSLVAPTVVPTTGVPSHTGIAAAHASFPEGHTAPAHVVELPRYVPEQPDTVVTEHTLFTQQPPLATAQIFGVHDPPEAQIFGVEQLTRVVTEQVPTFGTQHDPVAGCGHTFGEHEPPEFHVPPTHPPSVLTLHPPVEAMQQDPWTQGSGLQVVPGRPQVPVPQAVCVATEHVEPVQHEAVRLPTTAPPGVLAFMTKEVPVPGRQSPTASEPLPGATLQVNRKLKSDPQRITLAEWSLPVPAVKRPTWYWLAPAP